MEGNHGGSKQSARAVRIRRQRGGDRAGRGGETLCRAQGLGPGPRQLPGARCERESRLGLRDLEAQESMMIGKAAALLLVATTLGLLVYVAMLPPCVRWEEYWVEDSVSVIHQPDGNVIPVFVPGYVDSVCVERASPAE